MKLSVGNKIPDNHFLVEPQARNTAACIGYAAEEIIRKYGDGIMCIFLSDHFIKDQEAFSKVLRKAIDVAERQDKLVTIGIKPTFPSTGYGYINCLTGNDAVYDVNQFVEKPNLETVKCYVESEGYS